METAEELKKWTQSLSTAEKRFISLQGKIRSASDSQLLSLFEWLNRAKDDDTIPRKAAFAKNLPTLSGRLRALILDSLYLLHKNSTLESQLSTLLGEVQLLQSKKLLPAATRQLKKAKKLAYDSSRYPFVLLLIGNELLSAQKLPAGQFADRLATLRAEELTVLEKLNRLRELQHRHDSLLLTARQFPFSRNPEILQRVRELAEATVVDEALLSYGYLESALAVNILGIRDMFIRDPDSAVPRYQQLIRKWQKHPEWQADQPLLLLAICKYYQNVCIFSPVDHDRINADLAFLKGFDSLPKTDRVLLQELLYSNQFAVALNTGKFEVLQPMIDEIDQWMKNQHTHLSDVHVLPFLCNFAVADFMAGNYAGAKKTITRILNRHNRKVRVDIFEFALVLQVVLNYHLGDGKINDYLIRSGKRHFGKNKIAADFELLVLRHIEKLANAGTKQEKVLAYGQLMEALEKFAQKLPDTIPLLGLNEIHMWAEAGKTGTPIREIFLERVRKNLEMLEQQEKVG